MSIEFLKSLNGHNRGALRDWIDRLDREPRIAWYPSAGEDFRDLMYLHPRFRQRSPAMQPEPPAPDIFLHSDYFPWESLRFLASRWLYHGFVAWLPRQQVGSRSMSEAAPSIEMCFECSYMQLYFRLLGVRPFQRRYGLRMIDLRSHSGLRRFLLPARMAVR